MNLIDPTLIYLKASFATTAKTYQSLPSEFIFFSSFTMVKPGFCAKISSQISDPQKTTVYSEESHRAKLSPQLIRYLIVMSKVTSTVVLRTNETIAVFHTKYP